MRLLTADFILNATGQLVSDASLKVREDGTIVEIMPARVQTSEYYPGILCPGFINNHVHLELSGFKNKIRPGCGLDGFIRQLIEVRNKDSGAEDTTISLVNSDSQMWENGIQGAGDICNTDRTLSVKKQSELRYHSFVEIFGFDTEKTIEVFKGGQELSQKFTDAALQASIIPHAPYSVPPGLFQLIAENSGLNNAPWSIHNQESASENSLFVNGTGAMLNLFQSMGLPFSWLKQTGNNSIHITSKYFPKRSNLLLVHNTFTSREDIAFLKSGEFLNRIWFCLCPKANLFIENRLPEIEMLYQSGCRITVGTDSLASNNDLSILEELKAIHGHFPSIPVADMLTWASANGADYFNWMDLGRFIPGNKPGIISITESGPNYIGRESRVKRIL